MTPRANRQGLPSVSKVRFWCWIVMTAAAIIVAILNSRFLWQDIRNFAHRAVDHLGQRDFELYLHLYTAPLILVIGALLFPKRLRERFPKTHRWVGRCYVVTILLTSVATLRLAVNDSGGPMTIFGFTTLSILWFTTAAMAWFRAVQRQHDKHSDWMIRNYALTLTNVTFRAEFHLALWAGFSFDSVYEPLRVLQWIPNLIIAELLIRRGFFTSETWRQLLRKHASARPAMADSPPPTARRNCPQA